ADEDLRAPAEEVCQRGTPLVGLESILLVDPNPRQLLPPPRQLVAAPCELLLRLEQLEPRCEPLSFRYDFRMIHLCFFSFRFCFCESHSVFLSSGSFGSFYKTCSGQMRSGRYWTSHQRRSVPRLLNTQDTLVYFAPFFSDCLVVFSRYAARRSSDPSQNWRYSSTHCAACLSVLASNCISWIRP